MTGNPRRPGSACGKPVPTRGEGAARGAGRSEKVVRGSDEQVRRRRGRRGRAGPLKQRLHNSDRGNIYIEMKCLLRRNLYIFGSVL